MSNILVSVVCTNYNKGTWISEAIESFLRQETNFKYEILLIDDKSTDGSQDTIKEYAQKYPDTVRAFYNKKNLGITKTWIKICKEAKGKYIARCDGDDFWIDDKKLQKQVDLLESSSDSVWCTTDYNLVDTDSKTTHTSVFETGFIQRPTSYPELLATKGFTAPSAWLVSANLMNDINSGISQTAVDDTFNIQLDLFNRTKLTYIAEPTVAYRMNEGSDSRPIDVKKARSRDERLLETQLEYVKKYKDVGYGDMVKILLQQGLDSEDRLRLISRQRRHIEDQERVLADKDKMLQQKNNEIELRDKQIQDILNSKKYLIGKMITRPIVAVKKILTRKDK